MQFSMNLEPPRPKWPSPSRDPGDNSLFFAILPEPAIAARIEKLGGELRTTHRLPGRPISAKRLRMILTPIADYSILLDYDVTAALRAASTVALPPFEISFNRLQSLGDEGSHPLVLRCGEGLAAFAGLRKALHTALAATGYAGKAPAGDAPHVTLLDEGKPIDETFLDEPIGWTVQDFALVYSVHGESRQMELGRWPLNG
jgi:2'-5' RNA ligase